MLLLKKRRSRPPAGGSRDGGRAPPPAAAAGRAGGGRGAAQCNGCSLACGTATGRSSSKSGFQGRVLEIVAGNGLLPLFSSCYFLNGKRCWYKINIRGYLLLQDNAS